MKTFSTTLSETEFKVDDVLHVVKEASTEANEEYDSVRLGMFSFDDSGQRKLDTKVSLPLTLIGSCVFVRVPNPEDPTKPPIDNPVDVDKVKLWPRGISEWAFEEAKKLSGIDLPSKMTVGEILASALNHEDAPISFEVLVEWIRSLEDPEGNFENLLTIIEAKSQLKN